MQAPDYLCSKSYDIYVPNFNLAYGLYDKVAIILPNQLNPMPY